MESKREKHAEIIRFLEERDGIIDWLDEDITPGMHTRMVAAMCDGVVRSYCETETYMLVEDDKK